MAEQKNVRILHLESDPKDAESIRSALEKGGVSCRIVRVASLEAFSGTLERDAYDLFITDFALPAFGGMRALALAREKCPDTPFLYVSGEIGDDAAIQAVVSGATDYILKQDLSYLVPAVRRALEEAEHKKKRRQAEAELGRSEAKYRRIVETASEGVWVLDAKGITTFVNAPMAAMLGCSMEEMLGKPYHAVLEPTAAGKARESLERIAKGERVRFEFLLARRAGEPIWVFISAAPILDDEGRYMGSLGMFTDITKRKRAEETLRLQSAALESAANAVLIADRQGTILWVNAAFSRITGYSLEEVAGKTPRVLNSGQNGEAFYREMWDTILAGRVWEGEVVNRRKDGTLYPEEMTITPVRDGEGAITRFIAIKQDITERREAADKLKQTEAQLRQSQKMEAVGRLAGGVAHDFNNILTAILGYCNLLESSLKKGDSRIQDIREIVASANRAAELTRQLLAFSRRQVLAPRILDLNDVVGGMEKMLRRLIGEDIDLRLALAPRLKSVKMDAGQFEQVVMNLVVNSRDAMREGGRLTIETRNVSLAEASPERHGIAPPGRYVALGITDTGCGMDEKTKEHLFEPFFTTKGLGQGTGLGLSTVYGIVKQSNGYIWVESEPGRGAVFTIYLPAVEEPARPLARETEAASDSRGSETILLVEDDELVRNLLRRVLVSSGYGILEARSGVEGAALFEERSGQIDLVVTDVVMPGMGGRLLVERLKSIRPDIRVIYISGYTDDAILRHGELGEGAVFLQKPITPKAFLAKVRQVLGS